MKMIHALILNSNQAKRFAGKVVAEMVKIGCDPVVMRRHETPTYVYYGVLGGCKHVSGRTAAEIAREEIEMTRSDFLYT